MKFCCWVAFAATILNCMLIVTSYDISCASEEMINFVHSHVSFNYTLQKEDVKKDCLIKFRTDSTNFLFFSFEKISTYGKMPDCSRKYLEFGTQCDCNDDYNCKTKIKLCGGKQFSVNPSILAHQCSYIRVVDIAQYIPPDVDVNLTSLERRHLPHMNLLKSEEIYLSVPDSQEHRKPSTLRFVGNGHHPAAFYGRKGNFELKLDEKPTHQHPKHNKGISLIDRIQAWWKHVIQKFNGNKSDFESVSKRALKSNPKLRVLTTAHTQDTHHEKHQKIHPKLGVHSGILNKVEFVHPRRLGTSQAKSIKRVESASEDDKNTDHHLYLEANILKLSLNDVFSLFSNNNDKAKEFQYSQFLVFNIIEDQYIVSKRFAHQSTNIQYLFYISTTPTKVSEKCDGNFTLSELDEELKVTFILNSIDQKQLCGFNDKGYRIVDATSFDVVVSTPSASSTFVRDFDSENLIDSQLIIGYFPYKSRLDADGSGMLLTSWQLGLILAAVFFTITFSCLAFARFRHRQATRKVEQQDLELQQNLENI